VSEQGNREQQHSARHRQGFERRFTPQAQVLLQSESSLGNYLRFAECQGLAGEVRGGAGHGRYSILVPATNSGSQGPSCVLVLAALERFLTRLGLLD
jgi:hypothetical protein